MAYTAQEIVDLQEQEDGIFCLKSAGYNVITDEDGNIESSEELFDFMDSSDVAKMF